MRWPPQTVSKPSITRTPRSSGSPTRMRACAGGGDERKGYGPGPGGRSPKPSIGSPMALTTRPSQRSDGQEWRDAGPSERWLGRVVNAMGEPIDGLGDLPPGPGPYPFRSSPPPAHARRAGRRAAGYSGCGALNTFLTVCRGQRMGIFSGSGVGKSMLLSMLARNVSADISVIGLVGERGREVQEFFQDDLGPGRPRAFGDRRLLRPTSQR